MANDLDSLLTFSPVLLGPDPSRTVIRPFSPEYPAEFANVSQPRAQRITGQILSLHGAELVEEVARTLTSLSGRHRDVRTVLLRRYAEVAAGLPPTPEIREEHRLLIGAYFSEEYSFEAAALFNPSLVPQPDQSGAAPGEIMLLMSLRGIGEGHVSSVTFRTGRWSRANGFTIDPASAQAASPRIVEAEPDDEDASVRIVCDLSESLSETVLFPVLPSQSRGIEDLRLVRFVEDDGSVSYLGTYTAFDGRDARSELLRATGFKTFLMRPLDGDVARAKGIALFPRKIDGRYMALGRQDNENIWLVASDSIYRWSGGSRIVTPRFPWEYVQMGNCGSPIEIDEGWLVLTHGVGTVRNYAIGACLLDKKDPSKLLARTAKPLLTSTPQHRDGYVPNVVYSCGGIVHDDTLLLPFAVADNFTGFATAELSHILAAMD